MLLFIEGEEKRGKQKMIFLLFILMVVCHSGNIFAQSEKDFFKEVGSFDKNGLNSLDSTEGCDTNVVWGYWELIKIIDVEQKEVNSEVELIQIQKGKVNYFKFKSDTSSVFYSLDSKLIYDSIYNFDKIESYGIIDLKINGDGTWFNWHFVKMSKDFLLIEQQDVFEKKKKTIIQPDRLFLFRRFIPE